MADKDKGTILHNCRESEYLSSTAAINDETGDKRFVLVMRLGLDGTHPFKPTNISLPRQGVERLIKDLQRALLPGRT